LNIGPLDNSLH